MAKTTKARVSDETFDEFLAKQGILGVCEERAIKEVIAAQLAEAMKTQGITKSAIITERSRHAPNPHPSR
jgi:antitoxin HicB